MKTNADKLFKTNNSLESDGVWFDFGEFKFKLRRHGGSNSQKSMAAVTKYLKPYARLIESNSLPEEKSKEISVNILVDAILVDWEGIIADDKALEFTKDNAKEFFMGLPELVTQLLGLAQDVNNYKEDLGNS